MVEVSSSDSQRHPFSLICFMEDVKAAFFKCSKNVWFSFPDNAGKYDHPARGDPFFNVRQDINNHLGNDIGGNEVMGFYRRLVQSGAGNRI